MDDFVVPPFMVTDELEMWGYTRCHQAWQWKITELSTEVSSWEIHLQTGDVPSLITGNGDIMGISWG